MVQINITLSITESSNVSALVAKVKETYESLENAGIPVNRSQSPAIALQGVSAPLPYSDEENALRTEYRAKMGKGFRLTKEQKLSGISALEVLKAIMPQVRKGEGDSQSEELPEDEETHDNANDDEIY